MLFTKTVEPGTFSLLKDLMLMPELSDFCLVGGTALSLRHGHRISIDLDLFSTEPKDFLSLGDFLEKKFNKDYESEKPDLSFALFSRINNIKTDFVYYPHKLIAPIETIDGIRLYSDKDIAAMKINAILGRGVKKDFFDLFQLLQVYTLEEIIAWHKEKFPSQMLLISIPNSIIYFEDAEQSPDPVSLSKQSWEDVKTFLQLKVREYLN
ncbi:MAG: nucleotidyl transferase AbiEii/AbiGii toxin family protein [Bacteroidota bacterium]|nr:nucleotidyl transferase AbiEii/AbiGii toxin family protein [Bacteroidota bacterium]